MEEEALKLLRTILDLKETSLYDLTEIWARNKSVSSQEVFDEIVRLVYTLASNNLVKLETIEGEDGLETLVKPTTFGETYLKSSIIKKL
jgi:hypothetical protein